MLKTSLYFVVIALVALLLSDLEVSTQNPWIELSHMVWGAVTPDFSAIWGFRSALFNTVVFAFCGIFVGASFGIGLAFSIMGWIVQKFGLSNS